MDVQTYPVSTGDVSAMLKHISLIRQKYAESSKLSGEKFNIFRILKVDTSEVRTHSAFLAELLNPLGNHGHGDVFLKLFIRHISLGDFQTQHATVFLEKYIGQRTDVFGGRIDIVIEMVDTKRILIENKIYAGDQENQLLRYHNYDKKAKLLYLTLNGNEPALWSGYKQVIDSKSDAISFISYKYHITAWLEDCRKESANHPLIRETITQYLNLIRFLTNQSSNETMVEEIKSQLLKDMETYKSAQVTTIVYEQLTNKILQKLTDELDSSYELTQLSKVVIPWKGYDIRLHVTQDGDGYYIGFTATKDGMGAVSKQAEMLALYEKLREISPEYKNTHHYIGWKYPQNVKQKNLDTETIFNLSNQNYRQDFIRTIIAEAENHWNQFQAMLAS